MNTILLYQDSVQATEFDFAKAVRTVKGFAMDPVSVVPAVYDANGNKTTTEVDELLDYAIGECHASAMICGYLTDSASIDSFVSAYTKFSSKAPIVARPSLISDEGRILVDESVYYAVCDKLLPITSLLIINHLEAELLAGFECKQLRDFQIAVRNIGTKYGLGVWILPSLKSEGSHVLYDGAHIRILPPCPKEMNPNYSIKTAVACYLSVGTNILKSIKETIEVLMSAPDPEEYEAPVEASAVVEECPAPEVVEEYIQESSSLDFPNSDDTDNFVKEVYEEPAVIDTPAVPEVVETIEEKIVEEPAKAEEIIVEKKVEPSVVTEVPVVRTPKVDINNLPTISRTVLSTPSILRDRTQPVTHTATSSLVSPAKSIRDIARSMDVSAVNPSLSITPPVTTPAVTSSLKKETDHQRTMGELSSLRERLDRLKGITGEGNSSNTVSGN